MKEVKLTKKQQKKQDLLASMKLMLINCIECRKSMHHLCEEIGIKKRIEYFNMVEKLKPKGQRSVKNPFHTVRVVHNRGIIFNDGFEIKNVESKIFKLYSDADLIERRERS